MFVDPFGCGYSDSPITCSYSLGDQADSIAGLLHERLDPPCILVGYSAAARSRPCSPTNTPELVERLVPLAQGGGSSSPWITEYTQQQFVDRGHAALLEPFDATGDAGAGSAALHAFFARTPAFALHRMARASVEPLTRAIGSRLEDAGGLLVRVHPYSLPWLVPAQGDHVPRASTRSASVALHSSSRIA